MHMTYLSTVNLNPYSGSFQKVHSDDAVIHKAVMALFPQAQDSSLARQEFGVLWYTTKNRAGIPLAVVIQSEIAPDVDLYVKKTKSNLITLFNLATFQSQDYDQYLARVQPGTHIRIEARLSITKSSSRRTGANGVVPKAHRQYVNNLDEQMALLHNRLGTNLGVGIIEGTSIIVGKDRIRYSRKNSERLINEPVVDFTCDAIVTDPDLFVSGIKEGIGRAKAFGAGMVRFLIVQEA